MGEGEGERQRECMRPRRLETSDPLELEVRASVGHLWAALDRKCWNLNLGFCKSSTLSWPLCHFSHLLIVIKYSMKIYSLSSYYHYFLAELSHCLKQKSVKQSFLVLFPQAPGQPLIWCFLDLGLSNMCISYKWNYMIYSLSSMTSHLAYFLGLFVW